MYNNKVRKKLRCSFLNLSTMNKRLAIANSFTISNLLCGTFSIYFAVIGELNVAALLILAGAAFDLFDGLVARMLKVSGELGKQLDSLADVVTFGVSPAFIALALNDVFIHPPQWGLSAVVAFIPMIIPAFAAYRLAKFNIDTRQTESFIGLPTPAHAMFWLSIPLIISGADANANGLERFFIVFAASPIYVGLAAIVLSLLNLSEIHLMSLKFKTFDFSPNVRRYILIALSLLSFAFFGFASVPIILLLYFLLSISQKNHAVQS